MRRILALLATASALSACSMESAYVRPASPVPATWPTGQAYPPQAAEPLPAIRYADVFADARLQTLVGQALADNRDLRAATADILAARAQYRIQRADRFPKVNLTGRYVHAGADDDSAAPRSSNSYDADIGITAFELDLFGRVRSLTGAALQRYLATEEAARATRLTLVADVAEAWLTYAADASLLRISEQTAANAERSVTLTQARLQGGVAPRTDLRQAQTILATARGGVAVQRTAVAQDLNALQLLVGGPVDPSLLPGSIEEAASTFRQLPAGVSSEVLLRRPDVAQAEHQLRAANAQVGAARAALFPTISLTTTLGFASTALSDLFKNGSYGYTAGGGVSYPLFQAGAGRAGVAQAKAQREAAVADYEKAVQSAFRETADALARQGTIADQLAADQLQLEAASDTYRLTDERYRGGDQTFLASLDAQRSLYSAQRSLVATQLVGAINRVALYRALGGDDTVGTAGATPPR
ncbi:MAG: efflux transporter outer membrane subunit [Caulobacter sp.]|nr:efflux transporter outer membrane subunit [Caulobacter sp.]